MRGPRRMPHAVSTGVRAACSDRARAGAAVSGGARVLRWLQAAAIQNVVLMVAIGAVAAGASYPLNTFAYERFAGDFQSFSRYVSPWIEESLKAVPLVFLIRTRRVGLPVDAASPASRLVRALRWSRTSTTSRCGRMRRSWCRSFAASAPRSCTAARRVLCDDLGDALRKAAERRSAAASAGFPRGRALHSVFNILLVRPVLATLAILFVLPLVIYWVFQHSERTLRDWLDADLDSNVQLLESINSGTFLDSHSGRYLQSLRERFHGEDLADMLCCCACTANSRCAPRACCCCARAAWRSCRSTTKLGTSSLNLRSSNARSVKPACSHCVR